MRMWMVNPKIMCNQHLLGEHVEHHMFVGTIKKKMSLEGYVRNNCVEPDSISARHTALVAEMENREMNHRSPLDSYDIGYLPIEHQRVKINKAKSQKDLLKRCHKCRARYEND